MNLQRSFNCLILAFICLSNSLETRTQHEALSWRIQERIIELNVEENCPLGTELGTVASPSQSTTAALRYQLGSRSKLFAVDEQSGQLMTIASIDAEALCAKAKEQESLGINSVILENSASNDATDDFFDTVTCKPNGLLLVHLDVNALMPDASLRAVHRVTVRVHDLNDNWPRFDQSQWHRQLKEMLYRKGRRIDLPKAIDEDLLDEYSRVRYHLEPVRGEADGSLSIPFRLEISASGQPGLVLTEDLDAELKTRHEFALVASSSSPMWTPSGDQWNVHLANKPAVPAESRLLIVIEVDDMNDNEPRFDSPTFNVSVAEDTPPDTVILQLIAHDPDSTAQLIYSLGSSTENVLLSSTFTIEPNGQVRLRSFLDYELRHMYKVPVKVSDGEFVAQAHLFVHVLDVNDEQPQFEINPQHLLADENAPAGKLIGRVRIRDPDSKSVNGEVRCWEPLEKQKRQALTFSPDPSVNPTSAVYDLTTRIVLDREALTELEPEKQQLTVHLICSDGNPLTEHENRLNVQHTATMTATLMVRDENDHSPVFSQSIYHVTLAENNQLGERVVQVSATDADEGENARITYSLLDRANFKVDPLTGWITTNVVLDRETRDTYQVTIIAADQGKPRLSSSALMNLTVLDTNDHYPLLLNHEDWVNPPDQTVLPRTGRLSASGNLFAVAEHLPPHTYIGDVYAKDEDLGLNSQLVFTLLPPDVQKNQYSSRFRLLENGSLYTTVDLDREEKEQYHLLVSVCDASPTEPLTSTGTITVLVLDVNDHAPVFGQPDGLLPSNRTMKPSSLDVFVPAGRYDRPFWDDPMNEEPSSLENHKPTVHLSVHEKPGFVVTTLQAKDADTGRNGRVTYRLIEVANVSSVPRSVHSRAAPLLHVRPDQGDVIVHRHMTVRDLGRHYFDVSASDDGYPHPKKDDKLLIVLVEEKPAIGVQPNSLHASSYYSSNMTKPHFEFWLFEGRSNVFIITVLASVSGLLAIVLITATLFVVKPCSSGGNRCCPRAGTQRAPSDRPATAPGCAENGNGYTGPEVNGNRFYYGFTTTGLTDHSDELCVGGNGDPSLLGRYIDERRYSCGGNGCGYADTNCTYRMNPGNNAADHWGKPRYIPNTSMKNNTVHGELLLRNQNIAKSEMTSNLIHNLKDGFIASADGNSQVTAADRLREITIRPKCNHPNEKSTENEWSPIILPRSTSLAGIQIRPDKEQFTETYNEHSFSIVKPIPVPAISPCSPFRTVDEYGNPNKPVMLIHNSGAPTSLIQSVSIPKTDFKPWIRQRIDSQLTNCPSFERLIVSVSHSAEEANSDSGRGASEEEELPFNIANPTVRFLGSSDRVHQRPTVEEHVTTRPVSAYDEQYI